MFNLFQSPSIFVVTSSSCRIIRCPRPWRHSAIEIGERKKNQSHSHSVTPVTVCLCFLVCFVWWGNLILISPLSVCQDIFRSAISGVQAHLWDRKERILLVVQMSDFCFWDSLVLFQLQQLRRMNANPEEYVYNGNKD